MESLDGHFSEVLLYTEIDLKSFFEYKLLISNRAVIVLIISGHIPQDIFHLGGVFAQDCLKRVSYLLLLKEEILISVEGRQCL